MRRSGLHCAREPARPSRAWPVEGDAEGADAEKRHHRRTEAADRPAYPHGAGLQLAAGQLVGSRRRARDQIRDAESRTEQLALVERRETALREAGPMERLPE